jgi:hypothetical protein
MSGGFSLKFSGLDACSQSMGEQAGQFGAISDSFSGSPATGSAFGSISVSGQLSSLTSQLHEAHGRQFGSAAEFLSATERALDTARQGYAKTEAVNTYDAKNV